MSICINISGSNLNPFSYSENKEHLYDCNHNNTDSLIPILTAHPELAKVISSDVKSTVLLEFYKESGKYYTEVQYETSMPSMNDVIDELMDKLASGSINYSFPYIRVSIKEPTKWGCPHMVIRPEKLLPPKASVNNTGLTNWGNTRT